ncbi:AAA domain-containing protein [Aromatoleum tolulyticum]|uniref:AAA domain-containing protein n=1 Tax=Aromatoleum tolulyticum TaxID=34027 RepID=A0A1N6UQZ3_9RHOO|nr:ATP-binding protein [Aromatoleum tolulyticum]SIQ68044.1 AAA domain-containing protein [Aromatoleum tolulyticum]
MTNTTADNDMPPDGNPFLEPLADHLFAKDLPQRLASSPQDGIDTRSLGPQARLDLLDLLQETMFEPTSTSLEIAMRVYRLIRRGYRARDPRLAAVRAMSMTIARFAGNEARTLPWLTTQAKGMRVSGITGLGKTYEVIRALRLLPQSIEHGRCQAAGWEHMLQAVWLYVAMSHDGSLGGLLLQILCALDSAIGTSYATDRSLTRLSNEKLAVHIGIILRNHAVGVLVIDELQSRNFCSGAHGALTATFFLRLLNFGIPVVLIGNPLGLDALDSFSQDMRRINSGGSIELHPLEADEFDWTDCLAKALWRYDVMPESTSIEDPNGTLLFRYSGGIRDYACRIRAASQRLAIELGDRAVTELHMEQAFLGHDFSDRERALIRGFRDQDPTLLMDYTDVPWQRYAERWGRLPSASRGTAPDSPTANTRQAKGNAGKAYGSEVRPKGQDTTTPRVPVTERARATVRAKRTRKEKELQRRAEVRTGLDPSDVRHSGLQELLLTGFEVLRANGARA